MVLRWACLASSLLVHNRMEKLQSAQAMRKAMIVTRGAVNKLNFATNSSPAFVSVRLSVVAVLRGHSATMISYFVNKVAHSIR